MQKLKLLSLMPLLLAAVLSQPQQANAAPIGAGNLVVVRIGATGGPTLSSAATANFLDEYSTTGVLQQTIALPTDPATGALTNSGTATSNGALDLSSDGRFLTLGGYNAAVGTASVTGSTSANINRTIGRVAVADGSVDVSTRLSDAYSGDNFRSVTTTDGSSFFTGGSSSGSGATATGGVRSAPLGSTTSTSIAATPNNTRNVNINDFIGQLFVSSSSTGNVGINRVGTGLPTTSGQTTTLIAASASPYAFLFTDANTLYVADDTTGTNGANGGVRKFTSTDGFATLANTTLVYSSGVAGSTVSIRGLTMGSDGTFYATTTTASANSIVSFTDTGTGFSTFNTVATAGANTVFRGVSFVTVQPVPEPTTIAMLLMGLSGIGGTRLKKRKKRATN